ncbi:hemerythrin domain-containing protein [Oerskovia sp. M15]
MLPHALAEEAAMYPHAHRDEHARLLVDAMIAEHGVIGELVDALDSAPNPVRAAAHARALQVLFETHLTKENEQILPLLALSSDVSLAAVLDGMHELLGGHSHGEAGEPAAGAEPGGAGGCGCGGGAGAAAVAPRRGACRGRPGRRCSHPGRDARGRRALVRMRRARRRRQPPGARRPRGAARDPARDDLRGARGRRARCGHGAPRPARPLPLLAQVDARWPGTFAVDYLERGPETWALAFTR